MVDKNNICSKLLLLLCVFGVCLATMQSTAAVIVSEIMANPAGSDSNYEYLELFAANNTNVSGWYFEGIDYTFAENTSIHGYFVLGKSEVPQANDSFSGSLSNSGESILLLDASGVLIFNATYDNVVENQSLEYKQELQKFVLGEFGGSAGKALETVSVDVHENNNASTVSNASNITSSTNTAHNNSSDSSTNSTNTSSSDSSNTDNDNNESDTSNESNSNNNNNDEEEESDEQEENENNNDNNNENEEQGTEEQEENTRNFAFIQSFYTRTKNFEEGKVVNFYSTVGQGDIDLPLQAVLTVNKEVLFEQDLVLAVGDKEKLTFEVELVGGNNTLLLELFEDEVLVQEELLSVDAEVLNKSNDEETSNNEETEQKESKKEVRTSTTKTHKNEKSSDETSEPSQSSLQGATVLTGASIEDLSEHYEEHIEQIKEQTVTNRFKNSSLLFSSGKAESETQKTSRLSTTLLLGASVLFNMIMIGRK